MFNEFKVRYLSNLLDWMNPVAHYYLIQTGPFLVFWDRWGAFRPLPLNSKGLSSATWADDVIWRVNYVMFSNGGYLGFAILYFLIFSKTSKKHQNWPKSYQLKISKSLVKKEPTGNFHSFFNIGEVNLLQKVQYFVRFFLRQRNLVRSGFFELGFEHGLENWWVHTHYHTMDMKLLIFYDKNQVTVFPRLRKPMFPLFCLVDAWSIEKKGKKCNETLAPSGCLRHSKSTLLKQIDSNFSVYCPPNFG